MARYDNMKDPISQAVLKYCDDIGVDLTHVKSITVKAGVREPTVVMLEMLAPVIKLTISDSTQ